MEQISVDVSKLASAKNEELISLATHFGIPHDPASLNRQAVMVAIKEKVAEGKATGKKVNVIFHNSPNTPSEVYVELNGHAFRYPKDVEVSVPEEILAVINDGVEWRTEYDADNRPTRRRYQTQTYSHVS
jgi:hypothetical protein